MIDSIYNKEMDSIDWNDANVLRNLPDGWYSVPSDSKYGDMINKDPDIKYNDSVEKAKKRHEVILEKEREIDDFIKSERLRNEFKTCSHKNYSYKGHQICAVCGLTKRGLNQFAFNEGDESRLHVTTKKSSDEIMSRMCDKARGIFRRIISDLSFEQVTIGDSLDELLRVFRTYVLTDDDRGNRNFRISARPEGLCAALLWRELLIRKVSMTMLEFSKRVKVDRMTISCVFKRLDDYKDFSVGKRGRPKLILNDRFCVIKKDDRPTEEFQTQTNETRK